MNVAVNGRFLTRRMTGVERYSTEILRRLPSRIQGLDRLRVIRPQGDLDFWGQGWEQLYLPAKLRRGEILWSPANTGPLRVRNQVATFHDLSPLEHPEWFTPAFSLLYRLLIPALVRTVKKVVTPSETVRQKVRTRFGLSGETVQSVPGGVDRAVFHPIQERPSGLPEQYLLFLGSLQPRKNLHTLLQAWGSLQESYPDLSLLIAGASGPVFQPVSRQVFRRAQLHAPDKWVRFTGYFPEAQLPRLYAHAAAFVLPSFDEGFGLPLLEAMACGAPVLAARAGALPEVAGEAALYFDPADPGSLVKALVSCLEDPGMRQAMRLKGLERVERFTWQNSADRLWRVLQECT